MPLPSPRLDDRRFEDLVKEAQDLIRNRSPAWTDFSPSDPGMTLVEVFAFLTDTILYRLNRLPEKVYVALLDLLGASPLPPAAARVTLTFARAGEGQSDIAVPVGTRVSDPTGAVVFATTEDVTVAAGQAEIEATAIHADTVEAELVGIGNGAPSQSFRLRRPPIVRDLGDIWSVMIGVAADAAGLDAEAIVREHDGKAFRIWREVNSFLGFGADDCVYALDRSDGLVTFAPARAVGESGSLTMAAVPPKGAEIRAWYRRGGGRSGNVVTGSLTVFREPIPGLTVINRARASGGEDGETVDQALLRGREAVRVLTSAVTARDFERVALEAGGIARARAYAQRDVWAFGEAGVVDLHIVPKIDRAQAVENAVTPDMIAAHQTPELSARVDALLAERRPLGVKTRVLWAGCRPVSIAARVVISRTENADLIRSRLNRRLNDLIAPDGPWPFGKTLRASDAYEAILAEPGVRYAELLRFTIEDAPNAGVADVVRDPRQARTFFAAGDTGLFRSLDNGRSWTKILAPAGEHALLARCHGEVAGLVAAVAATEAEVWPIYLSTDGGEHWALLERVLGSQVYEAAWVRRGERPVLFLATRQGLRRFDVGSEGGSRTMDQLGEGMNGTEGFYAVAATRHALGVSMVAAATREKKGVIVSLQGGEAGTFVPVTGAEGKDVRVLGFQTAGDRTFLWAGLAAEAGAEGDGAMRIEARATGIDPGGWVAVSDGWKGGSCEGLDFLDNTVIAGSNRAGVLILDSAAAQPRWTGSALDSGLPIHVDRKALEPVNAVAAGPLEGAEAPFLALAATGNGVFISSDGGGHFAAAGQTVFTEHAPLPANWLYCSGSHDLVVVPEDVDVGG